MRWAALAVALVALVALVAGAALVAGYSTDADLPDLPDLPDPPVLDEQAPAPQAAHCPPELANCRTASGRILYVERVDPDGDGDAHFVLVSRESITGPGLSVIDVKPSLRPTPLPGPGDRLSAAGPVFMGSHGQKQIEAIELHVAGRP
jgi:hypothetical protein